MQLKKLFLLSQGDLEKFAFSNGQNPIFFSPGAAAPDPAQPSSKTGKNAHVKSFLAYIFHFAKYHDTMLVCKYTFSPNFHVTHKYASMFLGI